MKQNNAGCFTAAVVGMSRFIVLFAWIARPIAFDAAFYGSWIIPCLGVMILPFTTLMYLILVTNQVGSHSPAPIGSGWVLQWWSILPVLQLQQPKTATGFHRASPVRSRPNPRLPRPQHSTGQQVNITFTKNRVCLDGRLYI